MTATSSELLLDTIVAGVLARLRPVSAPAAKTASSPSASSAPATEVGRKEPRLLTNRVLTGAILEAALGGADAVRFLPNAVLTPTARDYLRINKIDWSRGTTGPAGGVASNWAALIVRATPAVDRAVADLLPEARRELLGCPDDAAKLAISEIVRGGFAQAVVFAAQSHRAACLANRHERIKAVAVHDAADAGLIKKQLRANVWCVDSTGRSYFELRNLLRAVVR